MAPATKTARTRREEARVRETKPPKRAICLAGGGPAAGLHIGVLQGLAENNITFDNEPDVWALSCIGAWVGIVYNQFESGDRAKQTLDFFRDVFRENDSFESFPVNKVFAPDWVGNAEAIMDFMLEPRNYRNAFLPRRIMESFVYTMKAIGRRVKSGELFDEGDFNRWTLNHVLAINPAVRFLTAMMYKSEIDGLARIHYPDSEFLKKIKFENLFENKDRGKAPPFIYYNAWNLTDQRLQLFCNRKNPAEYKDETNQPYQKVTPASLCACSALPYIEKTVTIDGKTYCEGALVDTVNFDSLLNNHHHPDDGDPLNEIWISRIVDAKQIRSPRTLHDSLANLCELFAATVGEDDVKLFKHHVREDKRFKGLIVEIPVSSDITYEWSHKNLDAGVTNGRQAAIEAYQEYLNAGGEKRRYGELEVIGEERTKQKQREITEARRAQNSRS